MALVRSFGGVGRGEQREFGFEFWSASHHSRLRRPWLASANTAFRKAMYTGGGTGTDYALRQHKGDIRLDMVTISDGDRSRASDDDPSAIGWPGSSDDCCRRRS